MKTLATGNHSMARDRALFALDSTQLPEVAYQLPSTPDREELAESYLAIGYAVRNGASELTIHELEFLYCALRGAFKRG